MLVLDLLQLAQHQIVVAIRDLGLVEDVVLPVRALDQAAQLEGAVWRAGHGKNIAAREARALYARAWGFASLRESLALGNRRLAQP